MKPNVRELGAILVEKTVTIERPPEELYGWWRNLENLPHLFNPLMSIRMIDDRRSHWVAKGPGGEKVEWRGEIGGEMGRERIEWRSMEGSEMRTVGMVAFARAPGDRGTEVQLVLFQDPSVKGGETSFSKLFGDDPSREIREGLRRLKEMMEAGEIPTTAGQPTGSQST